MAYADVATKRLIWYSVRMITRATMTPTVDMNGRALKKPMSLKLIYWNLLTMRSARQ